MLRSAVVIFFCFYNYRLYIFNPHLRRFTRDLKILPSPLPSLLRSYGGQGRPYSEGAKTRIRKRKRKRNGKKYIGCVSSFFSYQGLRVTFNLQTHASGRVRVKPGLSSAQRTGDWLTFSAFRPYQADHSLSLSSLSSLPLSLSVSSP
jgi:hypothetical protein